MNYPFVYLILFGLLLCSSCGETSLTYDEAFSGSILENDLTLSPKDNVKSYLSSVAAGYNDIRIYDESGKTCTCTITGGNCKCKLSNHVGVKKSCDDLNTKCTKNKVIKIDVAADDAASFASLGFKKI